MTRIFAFLMIITMVDPALAQSDRIVLASGKIVHGELAGIVGGYLSIIVQNSSNQAELRYRKDNIERIDFSDSLQRQDAIDRFSSRPSAIGCYARRTGAKTNALPGVARA